MGGVLQIFFNAGEATVAQIPDAAAAGPHGVGAGDAWCQMFIAGVESKGAEEGGGGVLKK